MTQGRSAALEATVPARPPSSATGTCLDTQPSSPRPRLLVLLLLNVLSVSRSVVSDSLRPLRPWNFPGKNTGVGCHFLLQGLFLTQGLSPRLLCLLRWQADSLRSELPGQPAHPYVEAEDVTLFSAQGLVVSLPGVPAQGPAPRARPGPASLPRSLLSTDGLGPSAGGGPGSPPATGLRAGLAPGGESPAWRGPHSPQRLQGESFLPGCGHAHPLQPLGSGLGWVMPWEPFPQHRDAPPPGTGWAPAHRARTLIF